MGELKEFKREKSNNDDHVISNAYGSLERIEFIGKLLNFANIDPEYDNSLQQIDIQTMGSIVKDACDSLHEVFREVF